MTTVAATNSYRCRIPAGRRGDWRVEKLTLTRHDCGGLLDTMRDIRDTGSDRSAVPGKYTRLTFRGATVMSDTPAELRDLEFLRRRALGRVLLHGLGLGIAAELALANSRCKSVLAIEKSGEVIDLVAPTLEKRWGKRFQAVQADAFEWKPPRVTFQVVWSDIWDSISGDNLKEMAKLRKMWAGRTLLHGFWCYRECLHSLRLSQ